MTVASKIGRSRGASVPRAREKQPDRKTAEGQLVLWLAHLCEKRGVTEEALAAAVGVSRATVFNWLRGDSSPSVKHWPAIAKKVGLADWRHLVPPDSFLRKK